MVHVRRCISQRRLPRERKRTIELKHSYIYDFGPRQCNQAVPASSDKSADALAKLLSLESTRSWWVGKSLAAAFKI